MPSLLNRTAGHIAGELHRRDSNLHFQELLGGEEFCEHVQIAWVQHWDRRRAGFMGANAGVNTSLQYSRTKNFGQDQSKAEIKELSAEMSVPPKTSHHERTCLRVGKVSNV